VAGTDEEDFTERTLTFRSPALPPRANAETPAHLLLVHAENAPPRHVPLHLLPLTVGRSAPAEVVLPGSTVSRRHCRLERQGDDIVLQDLESTNGTFVNSERITAPRRSPCSIRARPDHSLQNSFVACRANSKSVGSGGVR